jgi:hypothetical protein
LWTKSADIDSCISHSGSSAFFKLLSNINIDNDTSTSSTIPGTANYRHRVFEQVIPLRNQVWNPS